MSSDENDPFGSRERTVIRPNPGGRAPQQPGAFPPGQAPYSAPPGGAPAPGGYPPQGPAPYGQPGQAPFGAPPGSQPGPSPFGGQQGGAPFGGQPPQGGHQPGAPFGGQPGQPAHDPSQQGYQQPPQGHPQPPSGPSEMIRAAGSNPLITAATPLLDLLGRLRTAMTIATMHSLQVSVIREIENFDDHASAAGGRPDQFERARYILCIFADDVIQNLPDCAAWAQSAMEPRYFTYRIGGEQFYKLLEDQLRNPGENYDVLELMYTCLSLGFEGKHRASQNGLAAVAHERSRIHAALRAVRQREGWMISPRWKGQDIGRKSLGMQIPFWAVAALVALLLAGGYFTLRFMLGEGATALRAEIGALHPHGDITLSDSIKVAADGPKVTIVNPPPVDPPKPPAAEDVKENPWLGQYKRITAALKQEIAAGDVQAKILNANFIFVRFSNRVLFDTGKAEVTDAFRKGIAKRLGETFAAEVKLLEKIGVQHGRIIAIGHSDAQKISSRSRWKSNYELSKARAKSVVDAIMSYAPNGLRVIIEGRGPDDPVCKPAAKKSCWPQNRRVELLIERTK